MKRIIFLFVSGALFAGCSDSIVELPEAPVEEHLQFEVSTLVTDDPVIDLSGSGLVYIDNPAVGDSAWVLTVSPFFSSTPSDQVARITSWSDGAFSFDFVLDSFGGYQDSIVGSGFFSSDTLYFSYTYRELSSGNEGVVSVWSH